MSWKLSDLPKKAIFSANQIIDKKRDVIPWSPVLNDILGGGILSGSFVLVTGNYKTGKTSAALHFGGHAQKNDFKVCYVNVEHRLTQRDLESSILNLESPGFEIIQSSEKGILTAEDFIALTEMKIREEQRTLFIFDSISQLCAQDLMEGDIRDRYRDSTPLLLSRFVKRIAAPIAINDHIFIGVIHEIANQGPGMASKVEASGRKIQYAANFKLRAIFSRKWEQNDVRVGQEIHWQCPYSAIGPPEREGVGRLRYGSGLDEIAEIMHLGCDNQVIMRGGSYYTIDDIKVQGVDNLYAELVKRPELVKYVREELSSRLGNAI